MDINTCLATTIDSRSLALYANIVPAITSLILAGFVLRRAVDRPKAYLFAGFVGVFSLWLLANSVIWNSNDYYLVAGLWTPMAYFELMFFLLLFCFYYLDIFDRIPKWLIAGILLVSVGPFTINLIGQSVSGFDQAWCNIFDNKMLVSYDLIIEIVILVTILGLGIYRGYKARAIRSELIRVSIVTGSIVFFMGVFSGAIYISSNSTAYLTELYALFLLPIFILLLTVSITSYGTFRLGDTVAKALFYIFLIFSGAEFFFVTTPASFALAVVAFLMTLSFGVLLLRSYEREAEIRKQVEDLAVELQRTNDRQETLIHFIGHEVKGTLTKDMGVFAAFSEGDICPLPDAMKTFVDAALVESRQGAASVESILKASNLKKGTVTYAKEPFDLKALVAAAVERAKLAASKKGLNLSFMTDNSEYKMVGDKAQIGDHVLRNLIDNAINYTPTGEVTVTLKKDSNKNVIAIKDSGIGITAEDKKRLFTEGGHGADSVRTNVHSTGYGLYIAKQIAEAMGGTIRAESEGSGKGSTFTIEFPSV